MFTRVECHSSGSVDFMSTFSRPPLPMILGMCVSVFELFSPYPVMHPGWTRLEQ